MTWKKGFKIEGKLVFQYKKGGLTPCKPLYLFASREAS